MDNSELYKALNELYCSVIKVMSLVDPGMVDEKMRHDAIARALDNFLRDFKQLSPSTPVSPSIPVSPSTPEPASTSESPLMPESVSTSESPTFPTIPSGNVSTSDVEVRYCFNPTTDVDNNWILRRASKQQRDDCFYKLTISGETGTFEIMDLEGSELDNYLAAKQNMLPEGAVGIQGDFATAKKLTTVTPGTIKKEGNSWRIVDKVIIKLSD